ncbi:MAG: hypothetical protein U0074_08440 [Kouleothrix sp.]
MAAAPLRRSSAPLVACATTRDLAAASKTRLLIALGFIPLSVQLLRQQFQRANDIADTVRIDDTWADDQQCAPGHSVLRVQRGKNAPTVTACFWSIPRLSMRSTPLPAFHAAVRSFGVQQYRRLFQRLFGPSGLEAT